MFLATFSESAVKCNQLYNTGYCGGIVCCH